MPARARNPTGRAAARPLRIAAVEPYHGGSHAHFLADLQRHSRHRIELFALPARHWKWRVRGAALALAPQVNAAAGSRGFDAFLCSDFVNVPDFRALLLPQLRAVPVLYYLHENQMTYPLSPDEQFDPYFGFTNVLSCLSAEGVVFNSDFHRRDFLGRLPGFLPRLPDYDRKAVVAALTAKAEVLPLGLDVAELDTQRPPSGPGAGAGAPHTAGVPRVLWNHRWEFDKRPEMFFDALSVLAGEGVPFVVDVLGESFTRRPPVFDTVRERLGERVGRFGFVTSRAEYIRCLWAANVVVSTASQEFFGISMAEAIACGAHPVAPRALVYADWYAGPCARQHLYRDPVELVALLRRRLVAPRPHECGIPGRVRALAWSAVARQFDAKFALLARRPRARRPSLAEREKPCP